jgi:hypothetical protein
MYTITVPGTFSTTNQAMDKLRAAGFAKGARLRPMHDWYNTEAAAVRLATRAAARGLSLPADCAPYRLTFVLHGHDRFDVAGVHSVAKWAEDGLVDAGLLDSDRFDVAEHVIRVCRICRTGGCAQALQILLEPLS